MYSCEILWVKVLVSQGQVQSGNYSTSTIMEKKQTEVGGGGVGMGWG